MGGGRTLLVLTACERFYKDCETRGLGPAQLGKYRLLIAELKEEFKNRTLDGIFVDDLRAYRENWNLSPISAHKKLERLRTFFKFCEDSGWCGSNPAKILKPPKYEQTEKAPFTKEELEKIMWAIDLYPDKPKGRRRQLQAFVNVLRYTGMRIGDVVQLDGWHTFASKIRVRMQKTKWMAIIPIPTWLHKELDEIRGEKRYCFWSGEGLVKSCVADWQRSIAALMKLAGVKGSPHKFRHTFATTLLEKGVPTEMVARLLGHRDIRITQRHYSHWIPERQAELERAVEKVWAQA